MNNFDFGNQDKKFNWGAFLLTWFWGIFNKSYITLIEIPLSLIPIIGFILHLICAIYFGINGNKWALKNKEFKDINDFIKYQKSFVLTALFIYLVMILILILTLFIYKINIDFTLKILLTNYLKSMILIIVFIPFVFYVKRTYKRILIAITMLSIVLLNIVPTLNSLAYKDMLKGKYDNAILKNKILNIIPFTNKEKYLQNVGVCYLYKGDINNAIVYYEKAYKKYINSPQNELITYLYILKGDYNAAAERGSDYAIYAQKGDWEKTVVSLENKIKKSPSGTVIDKKTYNGTPDLYLNLAIAYKMIGKQDKALENLNIAIKIKPKQELRYREIFNKYNKLYHDYFDKFAYEI